MIIEPRIRGFICATAHPTGCKQFIKEQIDYVKKQGELAGPKKVLVIGASRGYGLASRIEAAFGGQADTLGVIYEKEAKGNRTATPGWYNTAYFEQAAAAANRYARTINGDAFSDSVKAETIQAIREDLGKVDLVVYSLAAPRRTDPVTGNTYYSALKPIGQAYTNKSIDVFAERIDQVTIEPATEAEISDTIKVMGGQDWERWIDQLIVADVLADGAQTITYSYIGPDITRPIYRDGTIGLAKLDMEKTALRLNQKLASIGGQAKTVVAKALITQASAAIPIVSLYIAALYKVMKKKGTHEGCIEQIERLFRTALYAPKSESDKMLDQEGRYRIDNYETEPETQTDTIRLFEQVENHNLNQILDLEDYKTEFIKLFGFGFEQVDYQAEVNPNVEIPSLKQE